MCSTNPPSFNNLIITGGSGSIGIIAPFVRSVKIPFSMSKSSSSPASIASVSASIAKSPMFIAFL